MIRARLVVVALVSGMLLSGCETFTPIKPRTVRDVIGERIAGDGRGENSVAPGIARTNEAIRSRRDPLDPAMGPLPRGESGVIGWTTVHANGKNETLRRSSSKRSNRLTGRPFSATSRENITCAVTSMS